MKKVLIIIVVLKLIFLTQLGLNNAYAQSCSGEFPNSCGGSCWGNCPAGYNFLCSSPETGFVTGCCPQGQFCPLVDGEYVQPSSCPSNYPKYCSSTNSCISNDWDCNNYVQNCGGYDYWFCPAGATATCSNNTPVCTPPGFDPSTATSCGGETWFCPTGFSVTCINNVAGCSSIQNTSLFTQFPAPIAGEVIDQTAIPTDVVLFSSTDSNNFMLAPSLYSSVYIFQTFTTGISGNLNRIVVKAFKIADTVTGDIKISIVAAPSGIPNNTLLSDEVVIPTSAFIVSISPGFPNTPNDVMASFNTKPQLMAGQTYAIRIGYTGSAGPMSLVGMKSNPNVYSLGRICESGLTGSPSCSEGNIDLVFATYITSGSEGVSPVSPTAAPAPTSAPTAAPTPTSVIGPCGISNMSIANGLITSPFLDGQPTRSGDDLFESSKCIIDTKAAFAPFDIPTFDDLKSLYYDQKR